MTETTAFERAFLVEDVQIRAAGDGRTVEAYVAVFNRQTEIDDFDGHYWETIRAGAFAKTIREQRGSIQPLFNHGKTIQRAPSERYSMPLGRPVWDEWREDSRGLLTVTRYSKTELADEILELIRDGALSGQSFGGRFIRSNVIQAVRPGDLPTIERLEVMLRDYGPAPFPAYKDARVVGVRAVPPLVGAIAHSIEELSAEERTELAAMIAPGTPAGAAPPGTPDPAPPEEPGTQPPAAPAGTEGAAPSVDALALAQAQRRRRLVLD